VSARQLPWPIRYPSNQGGLVRKAASAADACPARCPLALSASALPRGSVALKLAHLPDASSAEHDVAPDDLRPAGMDVPTRRESLVEVGFGAAMVATAVALAVAFPGEMPPAEAVVLVVAYAVVSRVLFYAGVAYTKPSQMIFVPMLLTGSPGLAPALVLAGTLLHGAPELTRARWRPDRVALACADAWYAVPPALVLLAFGVSTAHWGDFPVLVLALVAQLVGAAGIWLLRTWLGRGTPPWVQLTALGWLSAVDAALAAVGLLAAVASTTLNPYAFLLVLPLAGLLAVFARERNARIEQALELSSAYRGTALLLGDLLEHADGYTGGEHTHGVVTLATRVAREMKLDAGARRNVEFAALLHDIGKIVIPDEILNKPGRLEPHEWEIIKTHTIAGQRMLDRVGGPLRDVGQIVRASHERWDGGGYPDGLAGPAIPREAAIVAVCDAFNAMTTDRCYRGARSADEALAELERCAGSQFCPDVVAATERALERRRAPAEVAAVEALAEQLLAQPLVA
jgi:HD-GYP domain-containing protein (c-di-GMP phosphodiesterase class II)